MTLNIKGTIGLFAVRVAKRESNAANVERGRAIGLIFTDLIQLFLETTKQCVAFVIRSMTALNG